MPERAMVLLAVSGTDNGTSALSNASQDSFVALLPDSQPRSLSFQNMESDGTVYCDVVDAVG